MVKHLSALRETRIQSLGQEDPLEKEMATTLQYSCLENSMDGGVWWGTVHGAAKSRTRLSNFTFLSLSTMLTIHMLLKPALENVKNYFTGM